MVRAAQMERICHERIWLLMRQVYMSQGSHAAGMITERFPVRKREPERSSSRATKVIWPSQTAAAAFHSDAFEESQQA